ncbi:MAG TPA: pseudouridine synthase [Thermoanaerobaculia bacterium]|nr:pseudouridine synthase [Thermoanaerobaculia bacterium]
MPPERLQKIIAKAGFASRRRAEEMIRTGRVTVNGKVVTELGSRADAASDHVKVDGKLITRSEEHRYILFYKPREVMTTVSDPEGRTTVLDYVRGIKERLFPVGRLDYQSEGLILLTNDGELAFKVSHPTEGSIKSYHVKVRGVPTDRVIDKLQRGITIEGKRTLPCDISRVRTTGKGEDEGNSWFEVKLREGRTQQIRKMFKAVGHPVSKLKRVAIGPISDPKLTPGEWRELTTKEVNLLARKPAKPRAAKKPAATPAPAPQKRAAKKDRVAATKSGEKRRATAQAHAEKNESRKARGQ